MTQLVPLNPLIWNIQLPYASENNFVNQRVYDIEIALLRKEVLQDLERVQSFLKSKNFSLKVLDAYRPFSVQEKFWKLCPNEIYLAKPVRDTHGKMLKGSKHSRGAAVDVTLVDQDGKELLMPSGFDEFTERAHLDYKQGNPLALQNRDFLVQSMKTFGFIPNLKEWWHFDHHSWKSYEFLDFPLSYFKS
ncbi:MAG: peptidase M15 [Bdellovibrionaceae bacterium]|nr:peptidase M15 [Pseudobdellovibrionaceae bacterium]|tara:strand:+ start:6461 stop:7030 length:570 start_codon:yes stop_codon:yes gene_type:complete